MVSLSDQALLKIQDYQKILSKNFETNDIEKKNYNYEFSLFKEKQRFWA